MPELLYLNNTVGSSFTVTGSDVAVLSGNLKPNQYNAVRITSSVEISFTATAANTANTLKLKLGTTALRTIPIRVDTPTGAGVRTIHVFIEWIGDASAGGTVAVTIAGAGTDAQTSVKAHNLYVTSIQ